MEISTRINNAASNTAEDILDKAKPAIDKVAAMAHQAVDKAAGAAVPATDWLAETGESLGATQRKLVDGTCTYVAAHPFKSIGMALAAGFVLSRIVR